MDNNFDNNDTEYTITENDLKYKKNWAPKANLKNITNLNKNHADYDVNIEKMYYNNDSDTLEYRIKECYEKNNTKILDLNYLGLEEFPKLPIKILDNVEEIYASNNQISHVEYDFTQFKKLKILDLSTSNIKSVTQLPKTLIEFGGHTNQITNIDFLKPCSHLKTLLLSGNKISSITQLNGHLYLEDLRITNNSIEVLPNLPNLKKLFVSKNKIKSIPYYRNLIYLDCRNNNVTNVSKMDNLVDIISSYNTTLTSLPIFNKLQYLEIVDTMINKLDYMPKLTELICKTGQLGFLSNKYKIESATSNENKYVNIFFECE